jgi:type VI secretion system protein ImpK
MANARGLFADLFAYVLLFEQMSLQEDFQPVYEQVRRDITTLLEQQAAEAKRQGMSEQDFLTARFAVLAWADETILKHTAWKHHNQWNASPLQLEYYGTRNAGEELFERLNGLRADQQELREIYYYCLGLGFSGQYFLGSEDELTLNRIRHEQARLLSLPVEEVQTLNKLTPQPYDVPPPADSPIKPPLTQPLLKAGLAVLIAVPLVLFLVYLFIPPPSPGPAPIEPPKPSPVLQPEPRLEALVQQWLENHRGDFPCAKVSITAVEARTGKVELGGRVASDVQRTELYKGVQGIKGVAQVNDTLQIIQQPLCTVVELLEPYAEAQRFGLSMLLNKPGSSPVYRRGENLEVTIKTPTFNNYVYVDYYADKDVAHLLPNPKARKNFFQPGSPVKIGDWQINPPPGLELVTVIVSKSPLFPSPRGDAESTEDYLHELRRVLQKQKEAASEVTAAFSFIKNEAKNP